MDPDLHTALQNLLTPFSVEITPREAATLPLRTPAGLLEERRYIPALRLLLFGEGPELAALRHLASAAGVGVGVAGPCRRRRLEGSGVTFGELRKPADNGKLLH